MHSLRRHGDAFALILSSTLFALMHYNIYMVLNAFLMGLLIGYFVIRTGSIITGILMHLANNLLTVGLSELQASLDPSIGAIAVNLISVSYTHLDVYKRQRQRGSAQSAVRQNRRSEKTR